MRLAADCHKFPLSRSHCKPSNYYDLEPPITTTRNYNPFLLGTIAAIRMFPSPRLLLFLSFYVPVIIPCMCVLLPVDVVFHGAPNEVDHPVKNDDIRNSSANGIEGDL